MISGRWMLFLDELYSEMQALKAELEMLRAARPMNSDSKTETWAGGEFENGGRTVNRCTLSNRQQNAENKTESASKRVFAPVFFFLHFSIYKLYRKK